MYELLAAAYELVSGLVPFGLMLLLCRKKPYMTMRNLVWLTVFAVYLIGVFYVTGAGTIYDALRASFDNLHRRVNLIPFSREIDPLGYGLNVVMFLPLGFLVPVIFENRDRWSAMLVTGLGFSLLLETSQLLTHRGTDVDDLIMNSIGAVIGWAVYKIWNRVVGIRCQKPGVPEAVLPITMLTIFTGRFFLFNMLGLINLIYGF